MSMPSGTSDLAAPSSSAENPRSSRWDVLPNIPSPSPDTSAETPTPSSNVSFRVPSRRRPTKKRKRRRSSSSPASSPAHKSESAPQFANRNKPRPSRWDNAPPVRITRSKEHPHIHERRPTESSTQPTVSDIENDPGYQAYLRAQERADREWYMEDGEVADQFWTDLTVGNTSAKPQSRRITAKAIARVADGEKWEEQQLGMGMYKRKGAQRRFDMEDLDESGIRMTILVREIVPDFMDGNQPEIGVAKGVVVGDEVVWPVKDVTSNMAVIARKGSKTVEVFRETREKGKARTRYWELGDATGAKGKEQAERDKEMEASSREEGDWRKEMKYSTALNNPGDKKESGAESGESIQEVRRSLPVYTVKDELMNVIREHQICVIVGETGSGKTTQLTQYLHEEGFTRFGMIGCTQPRRVAAVSVAQRVASEFKGGSELGKEVGYSIRFEDNTCDETVIKYMTDGILLRESLSDPELDRYSVVIMDEAHERSLNTDVLFGVLRGILTRRRDLKVIITSATMNAEKFADFFGKAPIFRIPGRTHPVDVFFSRNPVEDYVDRAVFQTLEIHIQAPLPGDILIFMTGQEDIEATCEALADKVKGLKNPRPLLILPIYSQLAADLQAKIFQPAPKGVRKVVVATNIAETSLTIDGIRYVIDSGFCKLKTYNPRLGVDALLLCPASQSSASQRSGRAGRTGPGKCYRLFTATAFVNELLETNVPEIQRTNLSHVVLLLKTLGVKNILDFPFLDPPSAENVAKSMLGLWLLDALNSKGELTTLGRRMSSFPLDPGLSGLLFHGASNGCMVEAVTVVAMLSVPNVFVRPHGREEESDNAREKFFVPESDHLTLLHVYQRWRAAGSRADWCAKHYISSKSMRKAREVREQLLEIVRAQGMSESSCDNWDMLRRAIASAFYYQAARRKSIGEYVNIRSGVACGLHPTSALYGTGLSPDYVIYHELIMTRKEFMSCVTAVEPQWIAEAGPKLYILKQAGEQDVDQVKRIQDRRAAMERDLQTKRLG